MTGGVDVRAGVNRGSHHLVPQKCPVREMIRPQSACRLGNECGCHLLAEDLGTFGGLDYVDLSLEWARSAVSHVARQIDDATGKQLPGERVDGGHAHDVNQACTGTD